MAERHPWLKSVAVGVTAATLAAACSSGGGDDDSRRSVTFPIPTTRPVDGQGIADFLSNTAGGKCVVDILFGAESPQNLIGRGQSRIAYGFEYYRQKIENGVLGTEKLSNPWVADCTLDDGSKVKLLVTMDPLSTDGKLTRHTGLAAVEFGPDGFAVAVREGPSTLHGVIRYINDEARITPDSLGHNLPVEIVGDENVRGSLRYVATLPDGQQREVMRREFFPGKTPEQLMPN